jgi:hypothetical protein
MVWPIMESGIENHDPTVIPEGAMGYLRLGRAQALSGDESKVRGAYQDFLTLWKDADSGHPHPQAS